ncbi:hypothetical protein [Flaviaesturariibacter amylovorans]|uniref:Uncharacterized protein n=1 Tax=Flaviaesturariibacter amylovorans TaxID=1084520 RepID=A0ABP8HEP4_9BACT
MIEKQEINGRDVWLKVDVHPVHRENPNIIPTEYFTVSYYMDDPEHEGAAGILVQDELGQPRLFESPVAALTGGRQRIETDHSGVV